MASVNKVILVGNLGADPEVRYLPSGDAVANIRLATTDRYKDKASGDYKEVTEWHRVNFFGRLAEIVSEYLKKGSSIYIEGRIRTRKWQDQAGQDRYSTEIVADQMQMLGSRGDGAAPQQQPRQQQQGKPQQSQRQQQAAPAGGDFYDDDIPFSPAYARAAWSAI